MRDIKFRAWNKYTNTMTRNILVGDRCIIAKRVDEDGDICFTEIETYNDARIDYIPLQYTGVKDINGVEIFEGDIVKVGNYAYVIEINLAKGLFFRCVEHLSLRGGDIYYSEFIKDVEIEVIGNIYENKDELK